MHILIFNVQCDTGTDKCFISVLFHMLNDGIQLTALIKLHAIIIYKLNLSHYGMKSLFFFLLVKQVDYNWLTISGRVSFSFWNEKVFSPYW